MSGVIVKKGQHPCGCYVDDHTMMVRRGCAEHDAHELRSRQVSSSKSAGQSRDVDILLKHVVKGAKIYVELKSGNRFVGTLVDFSERLLELDIGVILIDEISFVSSTSIPDIRIFGGGR